MPIVVVAGDGDNTSAIVVNALRVPKVEAPPPRADAVEPQTDPEHENVQPAYPPASKRLNEEGTTVLSIDIDARGNVVDARIERTSGSAALDIAAVRGVKSRGTKGWHFLPATLAGKPVSARMVVNIEWRLDAQ